MINTMKKSLVLAAAVAALSAIAVPSMASAANWGAINSNHTLSSASVGLVVAGQGSIGCSVSLGAKARNPASPTLDILSSSNLTCPGPGSGWLANCTVTGVPSTLPWTATAVSATTVQMYMNYTVTISGSCPLAGTRTLVGTVSGTWDNTPHTLVFTSASGLTLSYGGGFINTTLSGQYRDAQQTLVLN